MAAFNGRNVRVRGLLDGRFGPQIDISDPDEIEVIENQRNVEAVVPHPGTEIGRLQMGFLGTIVRSRRADTRFRRELWRPLTVVTVTTLLLAACASMEPQDSTPFNAAAPVPPPRPPPWTRKHRRSTGA